MGVRFFENPIDLILIGFRNFLNPNKGVLNPNKGILNPNKALLNPNKGVLNPNKNILNPNKDIHAPIKPSAEFWGLPLFSRDRFWYN